MNKPCVFLRIGTYRLFDNFDFESHFFCKINEQEINTSKSVISPTFPGVSLLGGMRPNPFMLNRFLVIYICNVYCWWLVVWAPIMHRMSSLSLAKEWHGGVLQLHGSSIPKLLSSKVCHWWILHILVWYYVGLKNMNYEVYGFGVHGNM